MHVKRRALIAAFPHTIPVLAGFTFLGLAYGVYITSMGFPFWYPLCMSITIFSGSMQFVAVNLLLTGFQPLYALLLTLMVNARYLFYGISMLEKLRDVDRKKLYIIFGMCDESFTINYSTKVPEGVDKGWFMFFVALLDHLYWIIGSMLGAVLGSFIPFDTTGIDFVMTALFVASFVDQWFSNKQHCPAIVGVLSSVICLIRFGSDNFIIPAMIAILVILTVLRPYLKKGDKPL